MMSDAGSQWRKCRAGEIGRMVRGQQEARRRRRLQRTVPILGTVLVLLLAAVFLPSFFQPVQRLSLDCSQVLRLAREYSAGTLDPELRAAVERHLEGCPGCRERFSHEASGSEQGEASGVAELRVDGQPLQSGRPLPSQDSGFVAVR
jgi:hypothetical protein